jgi:hypothetical protein
VLCHDPARATPQGLNDLRPVNVGRKQDDATMQAEIDDFGERLESSKQRHRQIEKQDVGSRLADERNCLGSVRGLANYLEIGLGVEQRPEPLPEQRMIVRNGDPDD